MLSMAVVAEGPRAESANTSSCFPVYWQQFEPPDPDWFTKYAVQSVSVSDPTGGSPGTYTSYSYSGQHGITTTTSSWRPSTELTGSGVVTTT
jgi:hypothetical protein